MVNPDLKRIGEDVMKFLNEIQFQYSNAISFASGRPDENYFELENFSSYLNTYVEAISTSSKISKQQVLNSLGQYNYTKGIVNTEIARYLEIDEGILIAKEDVLLTVGTQEGFAIAITTLCDKEHDIIIVEDPTYIGITNFSLINGYTIDAVNVDAKGISIDLLEEKILHYISKNKQVKVVYVTPDYQNPTGNSTLLENRYLLLQLAEKYNFFIFEDNAYGDFSYDAEKLPTLKALDRNKRVIYFRSFSKTLYPSLRISALVANQTIHINGESVALSDLMAKVKGYITVNTSAIIQAVLGGVLYENNFSLKSINKNKVAAMKSKRDRLLLSLNRFFDKEKFAWAKHVNWNIPEGGFFITIEVPFEINKSEVVFCAERYHVIFTPMSFFYLNDGGENQIRLAFSNVSLVDIETGIENLSKYIQNKIVTNKIS